jgi:4-hydroxy-3-methylbut-2-enyl diphosphate reductase
MEVCLCLYGSQGAYEKALYYPCISIKVTFITLQRLRELDINIIEEQDSKGKDYSQIGGGDVVIFPAFGATVQELKEFRDKGVQMVDTTCPWVAKVSCMISHVL